MVKTEKPPAGKRKEIFKFIGSIIFILVLAFVMDNVLGAGIWGYLFLILGFGFYRMYKMRDIILGQIKYIESMIFGKPLDREMWDKGELKNNKRKVKFVLWNKKKGG